MSNDLIYKSVFINPDYGIEYDDGFLMTYPNIQAKTVTAYQDSSNTRFDLTLGGTCNVIIEARDDVKIYTSESNYMTMYYTAFSNNIRTDNAVLQFYSKDDTTYITTSNSRLELTGADEPYSTTISRTTFYNSNEYQYLDTSLGNGFLVDQQFLFNSNIVVKDGLISEHNIACLGNFYAGTMNIYRDKQPSGPLNQTQIAYSFIINDYDQLELIRYNRYGTSNVSVLIERVAKFGRVDTACNWDLNNFTMMNEFNGINQGTSNGYTTNVTNVSWTPGNGAGHSNIFYSRGYVGIGTAGPKYPFDVIGEAAFGSNVYIENKLGVGTSNPTSALDVRGTTTVKGHIVPADDVTWDLGTPTKRFRDIYLSGSTIYIGSGGRIEEDATTGSINLVTAAGETISIYTLSNVVYQTSNDLYPSLRTASNRAFSSLPYTGGVITGSLSINSNLTINGDLIITGSNTIVNTETVNVRDTIMLLNAGLSNSVPPSTLVSGIEVSRGLLSNYQFVFQENSQLFKIGTVSNLQAVCTRDDAMVSGYPYFDSNQGKLTTRPIQIGDISTLSSRLTTLSNIAYTATSSSTTVSTKLDATSNALFATKSNMLLGSVNMSSSNANLGIDNSNPTFKLDVNGDINFAGSLYQNGQRYIGSQWSNVGSNVFILGSNIAIGKSNAQAALDVNGSIQIAGNFLPATTQQFDLGSSNNRFKGAYVDTLYLSSNTLSLGGTASTILVTADVNQNMNMATNGSGVTQISSSNLVQLLQRGATSNRINLDSTKIELIAPSIDAYGNINAKSNVDIDGVLTVNGNMIIRGSTFQAQISNLIVQSNMITLNNGEVGDDISSADGVSGIEICRNDALYPRYRLVYSKAIKGFAVGPVGGTYDPIATKSWVSSNGALQWSASNYYTSSNISIGGSIVGVSNINFTGSLFQNGVLYSSGGWSSSGAQTSIMASNVGINTTTPAQALDIVGSVAISSNILFDGTDGRRVLLVPNVNTNGYMGIGREASTFVQSIGATTDSMKFVSWSAGGTSNTVMRVYGATAGTTGLDVTGDLNFSGTLKKGGVPYVGSQWSNNSSNVFILGSNIGIGTSTPQNALDVSGAVSVSSNLTVFGALTMSNQYTAYPSAALTSNSTTLPEGTYVTTMSSYLANCDPYLAFDNNTTTITSSALNLYNGSGAYIGSNVTVFTTLAGNSAVVNGEWIQIQMPQSIRISSYSLTARAGTALGMPVVLKLLASSNAGSDWVEIDNESALTWDNTNGETKTFALSTPSASYDTFRIVDGLHQAGSGNGATVIAQVAFTGTTASRTKLTIDGDINIIGSVYQNGVTKDDSVNYASNAAFFASNSVGTATSTILSNNLYLVPMAAYSSNTATSTLNKVLWTSNNIYVATLNNIYASNTAFYTSNILSSISTSAASAQTLATNVDTVAQFSSNTAMFSSNVSSWASNNMFAKSGGLIDGDVTINSNLVINGQLTVSNINYINSNILVYNSQITQSNLAVFDTATLCNAADLYGVTTFYNGVMMSNATGKTFLYQNSNNLGVGTSNPTAGLHVASNFFVAGATTLSNSVGIYATTTQYNGAYVMSNNTGSAYLFQSNNCIGIGTSNPRAHLHVRSNVRADGTLNVLSKATLCNTLDVHGNTTVHNGAFIMSNVTGKGFMYQNNGRFGIGTPNPDAQLHINSNLRVDGSLELVNALSISGFAFSIGQTTNNVSEIIALTSNVAGISFSNYGVVNMTTSNNKIGIDNSNPSYKVDIGGDLRVATNAIVEGTLQTGTFVSQFGGIAFGAGSVINDQITLPTPWTASGNTAFILNSNIGIGTSSPIAPLHVQSTASYAYNGTYGYLNTLGAYTTSGNTTLPTSIYSAGKVVAAEFDAISDRRVKQNIQSITTQEAIKFLEHVEPVSYELKDLPSVKNTGYIAQDVVKHDFDWLVKLNACPGIAETTDDDGFMSPENTKMTITYDQVIPLLHKALKAAWDEIKILKAQLGA